MQKDFKMIEQTETKTYTPSFATIQVKNKQDLDDLPCDQWACYHIAQHAQHISRALKSELHNLFDNGYAILVQEKLDEGVFAYLVKKLSTPLKVEKFSTESLGQINKSLGYYGFGNIN